MSNETPPAARDAAEPYSDPATAIFQRLFKGRIMTMVSKDIDERMKIINEVLDKHTATLRAELEKAQGERDAGKAEVVALREDKNRWDFLQRRQTAQEELGGEKDHVDIRKTTDEFIALETAEGKPWAKPPNVITSASYSNLAVIDRGVLEKVTDLLLLAKSWTMVWGDKLSPESLEQFAKIEEVLLALLGAAGKSHAVEPGERAT
jgi:hypothetical protein